MSTITPHDLLVPVAGERVHARHYPASSDALAAAAGKPCVVMAHGIAATQDSALGGFVDTITAAGIDVVTFDYRHFAASSGTPRQIVAPQLQIADYRAVVDTARGLEGIDADRVAVWGVSLSGGHVFEVAARDGRLAAMVALTPATDGRAVALSMLRTQGPRYLAAMAGAAARDVLARCAGRAPVTVAVVGPPGSAAALNSPGAEDGMRRIAGPNWRNEFAARLFFSLPTYRPIRAARSVTCPALVQVADLDQSAPPRSATVAGERARAQVHHYPCDHFDVYTGEPWHEKVVADQIAFLRRALAAADEPSAGMPLLPAPGTARPEGMLG